MCAASHPDEPFLNGGLQQLSGIRRAQLLHHVRPMSLDSLRADLHARANISVLLSIPDEIQDFTFAVRQSKRPFHDMSLLLKYVLLKYVRRYALPDARESSGS